MLTLCSFRFQRPTTGEPGERSGDPEAAGVRLLCLGWAPSGRRTGGLAGPSPSSTAVHVPEAPLWRETMLVLR
jgi:hypothetical protein